MALLVGCFVAAVAVAGEQECDGPYKGRTLTSEELEAVRRNHQAWLSDRKPDDEGRANLCEARLAVADLQGADLREADLRQAKLQGAQLEKADLSGADLQRADLTMAKLQGAHLTMAKLQGADLRDAELQGAHLRQAKLQGAELQGAKLERANLRNAELQGAKLEKADLSEAGLFEAKLQGAHLRQAKLQGAELERADLSEAGLFEADLSGANLLKANLQEAVYEPNPEKLPILWTLTAPENKLEMLRFRLSPAALIALREAFKKAGMRTQERQLTYAIEHTKQLQAGDPTWYAPRGEDPRPWLAKLAGKSESWFSYLSFEVPSAYGMAPSRALAILSLLILVFSLIYMVALFTAHGRAGIWVTWPSDRVYQEEGDKEATRVTTTFFFPRLQARAAGRWWGVILRGMSIPLIGLYFSLLSAFSLGWRELNVGTWIARVQSREYVLRATGWVRTVSGIQSLLSVYLLALWVLTYFGRPFE